MKSLLTSHVSDSNDLSSKQLFMYIFNYIIYSYKSCDLFHKFNDYMIDKVYLQPDLEEIQPNLQVTL